MKKIGLTGNIGSGKTTVRKIFEILGVPVYDSDEKAKFLINNNKNLILKIKKEFGENIYSENGKIDKKRLAEIIFNDKNKLEKINSLVHPFVKEDFNKQAGKQNFPYIIKESAILFETGLYKELDINITVYAPEKIRIKRVAERDNTGEEQIKSRIKNQFSDEKKNKLADYIIHNYDDKQVLSQVLRLHDIFKNFK